MLPCEHKIHDACFYEMLRMLPPNSPPLPATNRAVQHQWKDRNGGVAVGAGRRRGRAAVLVVLAVGRGGVPGDAESYAGAHRPSDLGGGEWYLRQCYHCGDVDTIEEG
jgi:hypothetical protein